GSWPGTRMGCAPRRGRPGIAGAGGCRAGRRRPDSHRQLGLIPAINGGLARLSLPPVSGGEFPSKTTRRRGMGFGSMVRTAAVAAGLLAGAAGSAFAQGAPIKIGILHSLSGTMAISETTLKDVMLMLIEEQNKKGGVLGRKLEAVVVDPASNWPLFAEKARELLQKDKVA